jgi:hypothetical protein
VPDDDFKNYHATYGYETWDYRPGDLEGRKTLRQAVERPVEPLGWGKGVNLDKGKTVDCQGCIGERE